MPSSRRQFVSSVPGMVGGAAVLAACSSAADSEGYDAVAAQTWRTAAVVEAADINAAALRFELIRCASLAPSSLNTHCWRLVLEDLAIALLPDLSRRCPAVDPDYHHVFVWLGCAAENLSQAALAHGLLAEPTLMPRAAPCASALHPPPATRRVSTLFQATIAQQWTRSDYDGKPLSAAELTLLAHAGSSTCVRLLLLTELPVIERVLEQVVQANTAQMANPAFVQELKAWFRFNVGRGGARATAFTARHRATRISRPGWVFTLQSENDKHARQIRSSASIAVFIGQAAAKADWLEVGRCYERFALQATALGIRNAFLNRPVEVSDLRLKFAAPLGLGGQRPNLVVLFGRGPRLPSSLRRPVRTVLD